MRSFGGLASIILLLANRLWETGLGGAATTATLARLLADRLGHAWPQSVIVENISGGAMNVGAEHVARAAPDGYTLMVSPPSPVSINHLLYRELGYDPRQFVAVALLAKVPNALV